MRVDWLSIYIHTFQCFFNVNLYLLHLHYSVSALLKVGVEMGGGEGGASWNFKRAAKKIFVKTCGSFCYGQQQSYAVHTSTVCPLSLSLSDTVDGAMMLSLENFQRMISLLLTNHVYFDFCVCAHKYFVLKIFRFTEWIMLLTRKIKRETFLARKYLPRSLAKAMQALLPISCHL